MKRGVSRSPSPDRACFLEERTRHTYQPGSAELPPSAVLWGLASFPPDCPSVCTHLRTQPSSARGPLLLQGVGRSHQGAVLATLARIWIQVLQGAPAHPWLLRGPVPLSAVPRVPLQDPLHLSLQALVPFHNLGLLIGLFSPRCADLWPATRREAVSCVRTLLYLQLSYDGEPGLGAGAGGRGAESGPWGLQRCLPSSTLQPASVGFARDYRDDVVERLLTLKDGLVHPDPDVLFHTCYSIGQVTRGNSRPGQRGSTAWGGGSLRAVRTLPVVGSSGRWCRAPWG